VNPSASVYGGPSTPTQNEARNRTAASLRDVGIGASPLASPANEWADAFNLKTSTARDRVKAATCVSFSPDGRFLAVGEVRRCRLRFRYMLTGTDRIQATSAYFLYVCRCSIRYSFDIYHRSYVRCVLCGFQHRFSIPCYVGGV
jgi:hypothetical protein